MLCFFILLACIFDLLDGRLARMGGSESPFGREFDSLADLISFGVAPGFSRSSNRVCGRLCAVTGGRLVYRFGLCHLRRPSPGPI